MSEETRTRKKTSRARRLRVPLDEVPRQSVTNVARKQESAEIDDDDAISVPVVDLEPTPMPVPVVADAFDAIAPDAVAPPAATKSSPPLSPSNFPPSPAAAGTPVVVTRPMVITGYPPAMPRSDATRVPIAAPASRDTDEPLEEIDVVDDVATATRPTDPEARTTEPGGESPFPEEAGTDLQIEEISAAALGSDDDDELASEPTRVREQEEDELAGEPTNVRAERARAETPPARPASQPPRPLSQPPARPLSHPPARPLTQPPPRPLSQPPPPSASASEPDEVDATPPPEALAILTAAPVPSFDAPAIPPEAMEGKRRRVRTEEIEPEPEPEAEEIPASIIDEPQPSARASGPIAIAPPPPPSGSTAVPRGAPPVPPRAAKQAPAGSPYRDAAEDPTRKSTEEPRKAAEEPVRKKRKAWWETFFNDDYLRTVRPPRPSQVLRQVNFLEQTLGLGPGAAILDVGCGLGLQAVELASRGYLCVGVDLSLPMLSRAADEAQEAGQKINFLHADMRELAFDATFDAVLSLGTSFGYFDDDMNKQVLERMKRALKPGGLILLDTVNRDFVLRYQPNLVWFEGDGCVCMEETQFNYITSRLQVKRTVILEDGRQREAEYSIRLYSLTELGQLMHHMGFRVAEVSGMEATPGVYFGANSSKLIILAEKRADLFPNTPSAEREVRQSPSQPNLPRVDVPPDTPKTPPPPPPPKSEE